mmetsp:Transcript_58441/g.118854  ORF Transcript_58441/g.118854 Transcript_58441/m.118854 type:complete len:86 (+) Transcript_58441:812-1069(+)
MAEAAAQGGAFSAALRSADPRRPQKGGPAASHMLLLRRRSSKGAAEGQEHNLQRQAQHHGDLGPDRYRNEVSMSDGVQMWLPNGD